VGTIGPDFMGLSFGKELIPYFTASSTNLINRFKDLGSGVLRITGNDSFVWDPDAPLGTVKTASKADIDSLAAFLRVVGWKVIYGIALRDNDPGLAADEAAYATRSFGDSLYCLALGNEPDTFGRDWPYTRVRDKWFSLADAILAADKAPNVLFSGLDSANNTSRFSARFANDMKASNRKLTLLSQHHYRIRDTIEPTIESLLVTPDPVLTTGLPPVDSEPKLPTLKAAADSSGIPFRLTETNSAVNGGQVGVSDTYAAALWCIDLMFTVAKGGGQGVNFTTGNRSAYSPLLFLSAQLIGVRPQYYGLLFFDMAGEGKVLDASINAGGKNISIYAIQTDAGLSIMFVNKDPFQAFEVNVQFPNPVSSISAVYLTGPGLTWTAGVKLQDATISASAGLGMMAPAYSIRSKGRSATVNIPAIAAVLVKAS
jgi:hypothetical protein